MEELEALILQARALGMPNPSLYLFLPPDQRIAALRRDIEETKLKQSATTGE